MRPGASSQDRGRRLRRENPAPSAEYTGLGARLFPENGLCFHPACRRQRLYFSFDNLEIPRSIRFKTGDEVKFIAE